MVREGSGLTSGQMHHLRDGSTGLEVVLLHNHSGQRQWNGIMRCLWERVRVS